MAAYDSDEEDSNKKVKDMEISEGRGKVYFFHFIGTISGVYEDITGADLTQFTEEILNLFNLAYDEDLKELKVEKDDEDDANQYKITCGYHLKTTMDPNKYINDEYDRIVNEMYFEGACERGFDLVPAPELVRWEGKFRRLHQKDYKKKRENNKGLKAKGLNKQDLEEDEKRRAMIAQKKAQEADKKQKREKKKHEKQASLVQEYADVAYQYDADNPNYKKAQQDGDNDGQDSKEEED